jgi:hypothetical protein
MARTNPSRLAAVVEVANQPVFAYRGRHRDEDIRTGKGLFRRSAPTVPDAGANADTGPNAPAEHEETAPR